VYRSSFEWAFRRELSQDYIVRIRSAGSTFWSEKAILHSTFRKIALLSLGCASGLLLANIAHGSFEFLVITASALCLLSVGLMGRYGLPS
jgi:hypothetical protein